LVAAPPRYVVRRLIHEKQVTRIGWIDSQTPLMNGPFENSFKRQVALSTDSDTSETHVRRDGAPAAYFDNKFPKISKNLF
jgi:hypothetical protein